MFLLSFLVLAWNTSIIPSIGLSPYFIQFAKQFSISGLINFVHLDELADEKTYDRLTRQIIETRQLIDELVTEKKQENQQRFRQTHDKSAENRHYPLGAHCMIRLRRKEKINRKTRAKMSGPWKIIATGNSYVRVIPWSGQYKRRYIKEFKNVRGNIPLFETYRVRKSDIKMVPKSLYYLHDVQGKKLIEHFFKGLNKIIPARHCTFDPSTSISVKDEDIPKEIFNTTKIGFHKNPNEPKQVILEKNLLKEKKAEIATGSLYVNRTRTDNKCSSGRPLIYASRKLANTKNLRKPLFNYSVTHPPSQLNGSQIWIAPNRKLVHSSSDESEDERRRKRIVQNNDDERSSPSSTNDDDTSNDDDDQSDNPSDPDQDNYYSEQGGGESDGEDEEDHQDDLVSQDDDQNGESEETGQYFSDEENDSPDRVPTSEGGESSPRTPSTEALGMSRGWKGRGEQISTPINKKHTTILEYPDSPIGHSQSGPETPVVGASPLGATRIETTRVR